MPDETGYCTVADVKAAMQDIMEGSDPSTTQAAAAIRGENAWLRRTTRRHWYDPDPDADPADASEVALASEPRTITEETCDIPSSPHVQPGQLPSHHDREYPKTARGSYARATLTHRDATGLDALLVRTHREYDDWIAASDREEGRAGDYYLDTDPHTGRSAVYIDTRTLGLSYDYAGAVVVSYQYGETPIPSTVRRAVALRAAAELFAPQDSNVQVPDEGNLTNAKTKADELREDADRLIKPYEATAVARP